MARGNAISWSQTETDNFLPWLSRNRHLSWEGKSRAYFLQNRVVRSIESLRGKKYQLLRKRHEQQRPSVRSSTKKRRRQYLLRRKSRELPESPPILRLGSPDPELWQMIQSLQTSLEACSLHSRSSTDSYDGSPMTDLSEPEAMSPSVWEHINHSLSVAARDGQSEFDELDIWKLFPV